MTFAVVILVPCDVLAVYLIPTIGPHRGRDSLMSFSFTNGVFEAADSYARTVGSSNVFGATASSTNTLLLSGSIDTESENLILKGIVVFRDKNAILQDKVTQKTYIVREGNKIKDLLVKQIREDTIILSDGRNDKELKIEGIAK